MIKHVRLAAGRNADEEKVRLFCEGSVEHARVGERPRVEPTPTPEKSTHPFGPETLCYSGNGKCTLRGALGLRPGATSPPARAGPAATPWSSSSRPPMPPAPPW